MRFSWGLGVGHTYSHGDPVSLPLDTLSSPEADADGVMEGVLESEFGDFKGYTIVDSDSRQLPQLGEDSPDDEEAQVLGNDFTYSLLAEPDDEESDQLEDLDTLGDSVDVLRGDSDDQQEASSEDDDITYVL
jgi:hypothetical protein